MKPTITINYQAITAAIRTNQGRTALLVNSDGDTVLVEASQFKPANHAMIDLPRSANGAADAQAIDLINRMNAHGEFAHADGWRGQRIYGQSPAAMFMFEYDFAK